MKNSNTEKLRSTICIEKIQDWFNFRLDKWDFDFSEVLYSLLGVQSVAEVVRYGRSIWFGHLEYKSGDDWVSSCRNVEVRREMGGKWGEE